MQAVRSSLLLACGWETEALFRSLQHAIYKKGRNKRLWFISLLFSNPSYYRTGAMFMMDSFREHFLPAHVTMLQTEAKAVWGVIKAANIFQYHVQLGASKARTRRWASNEELAWPVGNYIQSLIVPQCSPIASASPALQGTTVRRRQIIQKLSHNLPFTLPTSNLCVPGRVYFSLSLNKTWHYTLTISEQLSSFPDTYQVSMYHCCHFTCSSEHIGLISNTRV